MSARYISAEELVKLKPNAECCDCCREVNDSDEDKIWTIWHNGHIYCPECAEYENIGPEN